MQQGSIEHALKLMVIAHDSQLDKRGEPYVLHPLAVLGLLDLYGLSPQQSRDAQVVALLHDVVEDSSLTLALLRSSGFSQQIVDALDSVTRRDGEGYFQYIARAKSNPIGRRVKIADLNHNLSAERRTGDKGEEERRSKYLTALQRLREQEGES